MICKIKIQMVFHFMLPDLDSNQDKQNQNLSYYHYTIGQSIGIAKVEKKMKKEKKLQRN
jgi:hypothetical protein